MTKKNGTTQIDFQVEKLECDPSPYKQYSPEFKPFEAAFVVRVPVPNDLIIDTEEVIEDPDNPESGLVTGVMIVGEEGFQYVAAWLTNMIENMHKERQEEQARKINGGTRVRRTDD